MTGYYFPEPREFPKVTFMEASTDNPYLLYMEFSNGSWGKTDVLHLAEIPIFANIDTKHKDLKGWWLDDGCPCWGDDFHVEPEVFRLRLETVTYSEWKSKL